MLKSLPLVCVAAASLAVGVSSGRVQDRATQASAVTDFEKCATACSDCQRACDSCANHCATMLAEGKKEHQTTLATCQDCAAVCATAASIVARHGPFADTICRACAEACNRCATECNRFPNDAQMKKCAEACKACEKACRDMLAAHHPTNGAK